MLTRIDDLPILHYYNSQFINREHLKTALRKDIRDLKVMLDIAKRSCNIEDIIKLDYLIGILEKYIGDIK